MTKRIIDMRMHFKRSLSPGAAITPGVAHYKRLQFDREGQTADLDGMPLAEEEML